MDGAMGSTKQMKSITLDEVARHSTKEDCWIVIDDMVYDVTKFLKVHPGGKGVITAGAGKDVTHEFWGLHRESALAKYAGKIPVMGVVTGTKKQKQASSEAGELSHVPYAEVTSPFRTDRHVAFQKELRAFIAAEIMPHAESWDEEGEFPPEIIERMGSINLLPCLLGPGSHLKVISDLTSSPLFGGLRPDEYDMFHESICHEEFKRIGSWGLVDGLWGGFIIGCPPVLKFGSPELIQRVAVPCLLGHKRICLAISDPYAGSDVSNITCTARREGDFYVVSGVKKWITGGMTADFFATAVRTGGPSRGGISFLLIERDETVTTKPIKTSYTSAAGTSYVIFEDTRVPVGNLLGAENKGFKLVMANFNHERWAMAVGGNRMSRLVLEESFKWAMQRSVFGKKLIEQAVIREKLAHMVSQIESCQCWIEQVTHQMNQMSFEEYNVKLGGVIALLKLQQTRVANYVSDQSCQIFGGRALTRTGMGSIVEKFQRTNKFGAILGGSEEIMADLGIRQAMASFPKQSRL
eukprot:gnl/MRDRNA2_/MRDRNA2_89561_c0_seq1.p1 gnl/MRDRNA2_/MRDRNA2_89561_c0~~gnl/MRDRNA2_/MRDRNA2_89561_c0_seq1.p1  ORF type:complete len:563 (+),score=98.46 gnl/MRDRNA2_/MRDRNA2_89561_c0_seq1:122-1690(+)